MEKGINCVITHLRTPSTLVLEIVCHSFNQLNLIIDRETCDSELHNMAVGHLVLRDEGVEVHVREASHDELTIHTVGHATVSRNRVTKVLDLEGALQSRGKETSKWGDKRGERCNRNGMELDRLGGKAQGALVAIGKEEELGYLVCLRKEDRVRVALESGENVGAEIIDRADKVLAAHQNIGEENGEDDGKEPGSDESLDRLFGAQLDKLGAAEGDTTDVSKNIVCDDERGRQEEPEHALEDVIHDEVGLNDNQV